MRIGFSATMMQPGRSGAGQYVAELLRALLRYAPRHEYVVFALADDVPRLDFAAGQAQIVAVPEVNRPPLKDFAWHQFTLPRLTEVITDRGAPKSDVRSLKQAGIEVTLV